MRPEICMRHWTWDMRLVPRTKDRRYLRHKSKDSKLSKSGNSLRPETCNPRSETRDPIHEILDLRHEIRDLDPGLYAKMRPEIWYLEILSPESQIFRNPIFEIWNPRPETRDPSSETYASRFDTRDVSPKIRQPRFPLSEILESWNIPHKTQV